MIAKKHAKSSWALIEILKNYRFQSQLMNWIHLGSIARWVFPLLWVLGFGTTIQPAISPCLQKEVVKTSKVIITKYDSYWTDLFWNLIYGI